MTTYHLRTKVMTTVSYTGRVSKSLVLPCLLAIVFWATPVSGQVDDNSDHGETNNHDTTKMQPAEGDHVDHEVDGQDDHEDVVKLTQSELDEFGIELSTAGSGTLRIEVTVPGEVVVNYDKLAHIAPRFSGVVKQVNKHLGDRVRTGDVLAVIESNEGLVPYEIKSLLDGTVIEKHITIGEVRSEEEPAFVIADLDTVWVNLSIYQMHLPFVRVGQQVTVSSGQEFADARGRISYLSPIVDEHTRTATARVVLSNHRGNWRPGLFVEGKIVANEEPVSILVSKSSLQKFEGNDVVFVSTPEGLVPVPVRIGRVDQSSAEILSGLASGQKYVSKGGFTLKAELEKSSLSGGHSH
ncbi:MAG: efflux RND transporter periplasmic adaptor subunit [Candidatus Zixiibacteriota bacterium]